jgi:hypothetical protein
METAEYIFEFLKGDNKNPNETIPRFVQLTVAVAVLRDRAHERAGRTVKHLNARIVHVRDKQAVAKQGDAPRPTEVRGRAAVLVGETNLRVVFSFGHRVGKE